VRAFTPAPGAWTTLHGRRLKVLEARVAAGPGEASPGLPGSETVRGAETVTDAQPPPGPAGAVPAHQARPGMGPVAPARPGLAAAAPAGLAPAEVGLGSGGVLLAGTGDGAVELVRVQPEGRRPMPGAEFARGARLAAGERLGDR
jgi:methionyl-tRNA formyltransferase